MIQLSFAIIIAAATIKISTPLLLLSDLPTPSFIIDTQALRRHIVGPPITTEKQDASIIFAPSIRCPTNKLLLHPSILLRPENNNDHDTSNNIEKGKSTTIIDCEFQFTEGQSAIGYLHSSVVRGRGEAVPGEDDPISTFLAEIDLDPTLCGGDAQLVLGLNNHHVGGYYWARSAGTGSSMEAPGVWYGPGGGGVEKGSDDDSKNVPMKNKRGLLRWLNEEGFTACNSNDGKRSEWVNFLRKGDTVQFVPGDGQHALLQFRDQFGKQSDDGKMDDSSIRVFGISSQGRPMGSEPEVVCEWRCD
mmetsp:Transcript_21704/g.40919  ORF Transcript_21704/g.40919 Transcript_21704/m.40919 type:complete len:303 (-) Transcript_21704:1616-2524(-)|eukprot:CAMPEP_0201634482 /NCGR_PEP_ID=MMETSP0493-20130528/7392_1 /ASSEMBLY_ACC=CAM_ASM_000838 /TAXON_ID=420259 /ORGANISM="Thalassiosira gravida, Strain GMp14c1" /LENGTH=302 /DNA_ID=CAMNT_0048106335 /DNA_START=63 /DNA_END=971 /DNA_ORIENTATION=+